MKRLSFILGIMLLCIISKAQTPYYFYNYKGERIYISLNTEYAFLSVPDQRLPVDIQQRNIRAVELQSDRSDQKQFQTRKGMRRYYTTLRFYEKMSGEQYLNFLSDLKRQNNETIISPFFEYNGDVVGMSNFFYVKLKEEKDTTLLRQMTTCTQTVIIEQDSFMPLWYILSTTGASEFNAMECANLFFESGLFQTAEPDLMLNLLQCVNDTHFNSQWGLRNTGQNSGTSGIDIKACDAWQISTGNDVTIAVIDEGIELNHPDMQANIHPLSYDTHNRNAPSTVRGDHGVAVAGIAGAVRNNSMGIAGVAPSSRIMSISNNLFINTDPNSPNFNVLQQQNLAAGINWAVGNGADVINCSWGHDLYQGAFITNAINNAVNNGRVRNGVNLGCIVVAAAGNGVNNVGTTTVNYPASLPNVIAVGAINNKGNRAAFSDHGTNLDVVAPGESIYTTDRQGNAGYNTTVGLNGNYYSNFGGTSAAAPHVAGIAALILSVRPDLNVQQVRHAIESTCNKITGSTSGLNLGAMISLGLPYSYSIHNLHPNGTWNQHVGHGLVNAYAAVSSVAPYITGPGLVCPCGTTFTINNLPPNATVTWSQSSNLQQTGGSNGTMTFKSSGSGEGWVSATVNGFSLPQYKVWYGTPNKSTRKIGIAFSSNPDSKNICRNIGMTLGVISTQTTNDYVTGYEWDFGSWSSYLTGYLPGSGSTADQSNAFANIKLDNYAQSMQVIALNPLNPCSTLDEIILKPAGDTYYAVTCSGSYSMAYPNPANDLLNIEISEDVASSEISQPSFAPVITNIETTGVPLLVVDDKQNKVTDPVFDIRLYNEMGVQVRQTTATKGGKVEFNVSNLPNGNYYLHIYDGINDKPEMKQIIIKH